MATCLPTRLTGTLENHAKMKDISEINQSPGFFFFWIGQFMYVGKAADTSIHSHHVIQIVISFSRDFEIIIPGSTFKCNAAIIDSDQPHECRTSGEDFLLLNIAPESNFGIALKKKYFQHQHIMVLPAEKTVEFIEMLRRNLTGEIKKDEIFSITRQFLLMLCRIEEQSIADDRILEVLKLINQPNDVPVRINDLAGKVFLSPSRLIHLFTEQVGIPIRKYILWTKLLTALERMVVSKNISEAAFYAGFSDAPHLNRIFKRMFGLSPTRLLKNSQFVQPITN